MAILWLPAPFTFTSYGTIWRVKLSGARTPHRYESRVRLNISVVDKLSVGWTRSLARWIQTGPWTQPLSKVYTAFNTKTWDSTPP